MKQLWKRNAVVGTILVFVCAAIFLNGKYAEKVDKPTKVLGQSELVSTDGDAAEVSANAEGKDYFASARLTRQQARDSALSLLKEASENDDVDAETASEAARASKRLLPIRSVRRRSKTWSRPRAMRTASSSCPKTV